MSENNNLICSVCLEEVFRNLGGVKAHTKLIQSVTQRLRTEAKSDEIVLSEPLLECLVEMATRITEKLELRGYTPWDGSEGDNYCCIEITYEPIYGGFTITDDFTNGQIIPKITRVDQVRGAIDKYWKI